MLPRQISAHVDKQERPWTTFCFDVGSGPRTGRKCCNVPIPTEENLSFFLGGKLPSDDQKWTPNLEAVRASIRFAIATGRLEAT
jgi:hypothetical protein